MNTAEILHFQQKADTESGYMRIANSLQDKIIQFDFSKRQYKLIGAIMRKTFGYNKKKDIISRSQLAEMTGLDPSSISKATEELAAMKVIFKRQVRDSYEYEINTALNEWICPDQVGGDKTSPRDETPQGGGIKHPFTGDKTSPTKDNTKRQDIKPSSSKNKFSDDDMKAAKWILAQLQRLLPDMKQPNIESWANEIRLMVERDKHNHKQICELFKWANNDSFWQANILCPTTLRKQWDKLTLQMQKSQPGKAAAKSALKSLMDDAI